MASQINELKVMYLINRSIDVIDGDENDPNN